jgi:SAM-dependent methyltransferase
MKERENVDIRCRLCHAGGLANAAEFPGAPSSVERLLTRGQIDDDAAVTLKIFMCRNCGFVQLATPMSDGFYDDYQMAVSFSRHFDEYLAALGSDFLEWCRGIPGDLVEVGCGDGAFLQHLERLGFRVTGVEPSHPFRAHARGTGFTVHDAYVGARGPVPGGPYDAVVARQVLEHVFDIGSFMTALVESLRPGGRGLIEVPNLDTAISAGRFYDFFPDHVNYFSPATLQYACCVGGFRVLDVQSTFGAEFLVAFVERPAHQDPAELAGSRAILVSALTDYIARERSEGRRVAIWGAGGKGVSLLSAHGGGGVKYVVDSDPRKQGLYLPVSHLPVYSPKMLAEDAVDIVIITALAHRTEIEREIVSRYGFAGTVAVIGRGVEVVWTGRGADSL